MAAHIHVIVGGAETATTRPRAFTLVEPGAAPTEPSDRRAMKPGGGDSPSHLFGA